MFSISFTFLYFWVVCRQKCKEKNSLNSADTGVKYVLIAEQHEEIIIEQEDVVGNLFLLPDDYTLGQKQRFLQYMLRYLTALRENKLEVQVRLVFVHNHLTNPFM